MQIGFIGLGNLGNEMVTNLIEKGRDMHLYNRTKEKMDRFKDKATLHDSAASVAGKADVLITILSDDAAINSITYGSEGLVEHLRPGSVHVCLSTISSVTAVELSKAFAGKGVEYLTATILGRPEAIKGRAATACLSGKSEKRDAVKAVLEDLGVSSIHEFGEDPSTAAVVKIANNFLITTAIEAMAEAFNLVEKAGADPSGFLNLITEKLFNAPIYKNYGKMILDGKFEEAGFTTTLGLKDTRLAISLGEQVGVPLPFADVVKNHYITSISRGRKDYDWTSLALVVKEESQPLS